MGDKIHVAYGLGPVFDDGGKGEGIKVGNKYGDGAPFGKYKCGSGWGSATQLHGHGEGYGNGFELGHGSACDDDFIWGR